MSATVLVQALLVLLMAQSTLTACSTTGDTDTPDRSLVPAPAEGVSSGETPPSPDGSEPSSDEPAGSLKSLGFSPGAGLRDQDDARLAGDLDAMVALGAEWIRLDIAWSVVEPEPGRFEWSGSDRLIDAAHERGLEVLALLAYSPAWARPPDTTDKAPPNDHQQFARFVTEAVSRYGQRGVDAWQIWNEPNSALFWEPRPNPQAYGDLLRTSVSAVRSIDPEAIVVSGGLAPAVERPDEGWRSPEAFLSELIDTGALADVDAVGVHPYSFPAHPLDQETVEWNTFLKLPSLHQLLEQSAAGPDRIWITEYGAPTGDHARSVSEADQATLLLAGLDAARQWPWLGPVFLYALRDFRHDPGDLEWNYGILTPDGTPKQAWVDLLAWQSE